MLKTERFIDMILEASEMSSRPIEADVLVAVAQSAAVLAMRPAAILFDFDGTLSELVDDPDLASIERRSEAAIVRLTQLVDVVAIVTGRAVNDVQTRLDTTDLVVVGNHGLEWVVRGKHEEHDAGVNAANAIEHAIAEIEERLTRDHLAEGVIFENKRLSASIHYRQAPNQKKVGSVLIPLARKVAAAHNLRPTEGKLIVELRPSAEISKGTAMYHLRDEFDLAGMVFLGDDLTDVDGFDSLREIREGSAAATLAVGVLGPDSHSSVALTADVAVTGVQGVADYLERLVAHLSSEAS
jgi:trehalose-phosphatase